jgi:hypothetical protein
MRVSYDRGPAGVSECLALMYPGIIEPGKRGSTPIFTCPGCQHIETVLAQF